MTSVSPRIKLSPHVRETGRMVQLTHSKVAVVDLDNKGGIYGRVQVSNQTF